MKYLKIFELLADYEAYKSSSEYVTPNVSYVESECGMLYDPFVPSVEPVIDINNYCTFVALEDGMTVSISNGYWRNCNTEYCIDGNGEWIYLEDGNYTTPINAGQTISFRGNLKSNSDIEGVDRRFIGIGTFKTTKNFNAVGNVMSLLFGDNAATSYSLEGYNGVFMSLFGYDGLENKNLISVSKNFLPATTLASDCYYDMFYGCTSLTTAPELPATKLASSCYYNMFKGCTSLTTAPALPATELAPGCYSSMFSGCTSLTTAPELPATELAKYCYQYMFSGCTSLTTAPELPATTLATRCYQYMFAGCTSLTTAPELPATELANHCYQYMFSGCTNLNYIKMLATDVSASDALYSWVTNVAPTGTFVKLSNTELPTGTSGIPEGWTVVNEGGDQSPDVSDPEYTFVAPIGASISTENNSKFYTAESWAASGKTLDDVDGIAISNGEYSFMIHPTAESKTLKWGLDNVEVGNDNRISGYYMTNKIAESVDYDPAYAAVYCQDTTFTNGSSGYLMNESEFRMAYQYIDDINACLAAIGGTEFALKGKNYWTCLEAGSNMAKYWAYLKADFDKNPKSYKTVWVRPAAPITIV